MPPAPRVDPPLRRIGLSVPRIGLSVPRIALLVPRIALLVPRIALLVPRIELLVPRIEPALATLQQVLDRRRRCRLEVVAIEAVQAKVAPGRRRPPAALLTTRGQASRSAQIHHRNSPRPPIWDASALSLAGARWRSTRNKELFAQHGRRTGGASPLGAVANGTRHQRAKGVAARRGRVEGCDAAPT